MLHAKVLFHDVTLTFRHNSSDSSGTSDSTLKTILRLQNCVISNNWHWKECQKEDWSCKPRTVSNESVSMKLIRQVLFEALHQEGGHFLVAVTTMKWQTNGWHLTCFCHCAPRSPFDMQPCLHQSPLWPSCLSSNCEQGRPSGEHQKQITNDPASKKNFQSPTCLAVPPVNLGVIKVFPHCYYNDRHEAKSQVKATATRFDSKKESAAKKNQKKSKEPWTHNSMIMNRSSTWSWRVAWTLTSWTLQPCRLWAMIVHWSSHWEPNYTDSWKLFLAFTQIEQKACCKRDRTVKSEEYVKTEEQQMAGKY